MTSKNILVTGPPRCGKSTLIEKVILRIEKPMTGFFTREIKEKGWLILYFWRHKETKVVTREPYGYMSILQ